MLKQYNFKIETTLIKEIDKLGGNRSEHIRKAITGYIQPIAKNYTQNNNQELITILKNQITYLQDNNENLQKRCDILTYTALPFWKRWKLRPQLPPKKE